MSGSTPIFPTSYFVSDVGPQQRDGDIAFRTRSDGDEEVIPGVDFVPRHGEDAIAPLDTALLGWRSSHDGADHRRLVLIDRDLRALRQHHRHHDHGQDDVHGRSHDQNLEALPFGPRQELVGRPAPGVIRILARHLDVAAERNGGNAVLGIAPLRLQQLRPEAERKHEHPHAEPAGRHEMAELVHEHQHTKDEQK
jgi:hypothetical protein